MAKEQIFISYRNLELSRFIGGKIHDDLLGLGYDVFFDQTRLKNDGGVAWEDVLRKNVESCTVLLVLLQEETKDSQWVRREIEMAREKKAAVVPLVVVDDANTIFDTLAALQLEGLQYLEYKVHGIEVIDQTLKNRAKEVQELRNREQAWQRGQSAVFVHPDSESIHLNLLTGDATEIAGYDVLINTENTYMQMARYYESNTLSCTIRRKGSHIQSGYILDDFVQNQLYKQVISTPQYPGVPVRPTEVIITEAGHPKSELAEMDFRFIFHAATVTVDPWEQRVDALPLQAIPEIVAKCLHLVDEVNEQQGAVIYVKANELEAARKNYQNLTSILFPVFGAGSGGHKALDAAAYIIDGFDKFIRRAKRRGTSVEKIGLCIFNPKEAEKLAQVFLEKGFVRQ